MRIVIPVFIVLAIGLLIFNATRLDFANLLEGESLVALAGILAALCVILLMVILSISRSIKNKQR
jgi:hypothetical protein